MRVRDIVFVSLLGTLFVPACSKKPDDKTVQSSIVGAWTWNPREQLAADKIENDTGIYATPDQQILQFSATVASDHDRGDFVEYRHVPTNKHMEAAWVVWRRAPWYVFDAKIQVQGKLETDFVVLRIGANALRVKGLGFDCKEGCVLRPLKEIPAAARNGRPF